MQFLYRVETLTGISFAKNDEYRLVSARQSVVFFYFLLFYQSFIVWPSFTLEQFPQERFSPLWPIAWARMFDYSTVIVAIPSLFLLTALIGIVFYQYSIARMLVFFGAIGYHAFLNSFSTLHYGWTPWIFITFLFIFLPNAWKGESHSSEERKSFFFMFWGAQALILLIYSMAGLHKIVSAISQISASQAHIFSFNGAELQIIDWFYRTGSTNFLGAYVIAYPFIGWFLSLGLAYFQLFAFYAAFRPSLHQPWAFGLIMMHLGIYLTMGIFFTESILLLLIFFFDSPFRKPGIRWQEMIFDLPLIGWTLRLIKRIMDSFWRPAASLTI